MKYKFEPIKIEFHKNERINFKLEFNFSTFNYCSNSNGIFIFFRIDMFKSILTVCIKPIGEIII